MIIVTGGFVARPETFEALRQACLDHVHRSRLEPGCISHAVHVDCENPLRLFFFEKWADRAALDLHFKQPDSGEIMRAIRKLAAEAGDLEIYEASRE